jgi:hypothetical protein
LTKDIDSEEEDAPVAKPVLKKSGLGGFMNKSAVEPQPPSLKTLITSIRKHRVIA